MTEGLRRDVADVLTVGTAKAIGGLGTVLASLVLLRFLAPEQFGLYALGLAIMLLIDEIVGAAVDGGVLRLAPTNRVTDTARSHAVERAALVMKLTAGLGALGLVVLLGDPLANMLLPRSGTATLLYIAGLGALGLLLLRSALVNLQVDRRFRLYGALDLLHSGTKFGGMAAVLATGHATAAPLLLAPAVAPFGVFAIWALVSRAAALHRRAGRRGAARELFRFVKWFLLTFALAGLVARLDVFMLGIFADPIDLGLFAGGQTLALIPELAGTYLAVVLAPRIMPALRSGGFRSLFRSVQVGLVTACAVIYVASIPLMGPLSARLLPQSFAASSEIVEILLPGALAGLATFPLTVSFLMFVRPRFLFTLDCVTSPLMVLLYAYAIPHHGATGAAWVTSGARLLKAVVAQVYAWRLAELSRNRLEHPFASD